MIVTSLLLASSVSIFCNKEAEFADKVMEYRQRDHPISTIMSVAEENTIRQLVVVMAYKEPVVEEEWRKTEVSFRFGDKVYTMCVRGSHETNP